MKALRFGSVALAGLFAFGLVPSAAAQVWPTKPVKLVAVFPPGGSVDQVARNSAIGLASNSRISRTGAAAR